jgi:type IV pilus assembly protein PilF
MTIHPTRYLPAVTLAAALLLAAGCANKAPSTGIPPQEPLPPVKQQEVPPAARSQVRSELAAGYFERGRMDVALDELAEAVKLDDTNVRAWNLYGLVYAVLGQNAKAEESFRRALQLAPNDSDVRHNWGWYLCTHGRAAESLAEFDAALRNPLYKTPETAMVNAGKCSSVLGNLANAELYFRRALQIAPAYTPAAYNMALLTYRTSRLDEARRWMKVVMQDADPPAESLHLGMCIERRLGDAQAEASYASQLRNRHPESAEARSIATGQGACQ